MSATGVTLPVRSHVGVGTGMGQDQIRVPPVGSAADLLTLAGTFGPALLMACAAAALGARLRRVGGLTEGHTSRVTRPCA
jgi:hypothetical protein